MGCFQVRYDSRVIIYECKLFIRLATYLSSCFSSVLSLNDMESHRGTTADVINNFQSSYAILC